MIAIQETDTAPWLEQILERCDVVNVTKESDKDAWLENRRHGLGGSDTGTVLGLNPYESPMKLWLVKTGQLADDDLSDNESVYWGTVLEDIVAAEFARRTGFTVINPEASFVRKDEPVLRANPDRLYIDHDGNLGILEAKTADFRLSDHWDGENSPAWYEAQAAHYAAVLGIHRATLACLVGGNRFLMHEVDLDHGLIDQIANIELDWWQRHVVEGHVPPVDESDSTTEALKNLWQAEQTIVRFGPEVLDLIADYNAAHGDVKGAEERKQLAANQLRAALGAHDTGAFGEIPVVTNKAIDTKKVDYDGLVTDMAAYFHVDPSALTDRYRTTSSSRRLNIVKSKAAKALAS